MLQKIIHSEEKYCLAFQWIFKITDHKHCWTLHSVEARLLHYLKSQGAKVLFKLMAERIERIPV